MKNTCNDYGKPLHNGDFVCEICNRLFWEAMDKSCKEGICFSLEEHRKKIRKQSIYLKNKKKVKAKGGFMNSYEIDEILMRSDKEQLITIMYTALSIMQHYNGNTVDYCVEKAMEDHNLIHSEKDKIK